MKKPEKDLISRAVVDPNFRKRLLADPDDVIATDGYEISDDMLAQIKKSIAMSPAAVDAAIEAAARDGGVGG